MVFRSKLLAFILYSFITLSITAQNKLSDNLITSVNYHAGFNLPEYQFMTAITNDYVRSIDISISKKTHKGNVWEQLYHYPENGLSLFYSSLGNNKILGKELALNYFFKIDYISKKNFKLFNQLGIGLNYVTRKFNFDSNYLNVGVGSRVNIHFNFRLGSTFRLSNKLGLNTGISFDHFSNANTREPNLGINYVTAFGGISYAIGKRIVPKTDSITPHISKNNYAVFTSLGGKLARGFFSDYLLTSSVSVEMNRELFRAFHMGVGMDCFYDSSIEGQLNRNGKDYKKADSFQTGIHTSQALVYNRLKVILQEGLYLGLVNKAINKTMYNRGIVQYQISKRLAVRVAMKSHLHILDYPEIGVGITL
jgi:Lipid A 3-O-deacylase (PagL)